MGIANSYWSSSYLFGTDGHEYLVLSHVLAVPAMGVYRGSILDITEPSYFQQFTSFWDASSMFAANKTALDFASGDGFYFGLSSTDKLGPITTWNDADSFSYNLTYNLTSPIILNGGVGSFLWSESGHPGASLSRLQNLGDQSSLTYCQQRRRLSMNGPCRLERPLARSQRTVQKSPSTPKSPSPGTTASGKQAHLQSGPGFNCISRQTVKKSIRGSPSGSILLDGQVVRRRDSQPSKSNLVSRSSHRPPRSTATVSGPRLFPT